MDIDTLAEKLYLAYWTPTQMLTGRAIAPWAGQHEAEKRAWRSVANRAIAELTQKD